MLNYTVCPYHRYTLGIRWRKNQQCSFPEHSGKAKPERAVNCKMSQFTMYRRGCLLPIGSGICRSCRGIIYKEMAESNMSIEHILPKETQKESVELEEFNTTEHDCKRRRTCPNYYEQTNFMALTDLTDTASEESSQKESQTSNWSDENIDENKDAINQAFDIISRGKLSPLKYVIRSNLDELQPSTRRYIKRKASAATDLLLNGIAPGQGDKLFKLIQEQDSPKAEDGNLKEIVVNLYQESTNKQQKKQLLSMIAKTATKKDLQNLIPGLTVHAINEARKHASTNGAGTQVESQNPCYRRKMDIEKMDHALDFFFSQNFYQISSFGTKIMKLKSGEEVNIPEVVRTACHSTLVTVYQSFCRETNFSPLSRSTLFHILSVCPASHRTNLRGLDNIAADGSVAFDTLTLSISDIEKHVADDAILTQLQECRDNLCALKIYFKTDLKIHLKQEDTCADHCMNYALSDSGDPSLKVTCLHQHDMICEKCDLLPQTLTTVKEVLSQLNIPEEMRTELSIDITASEQKLFEWKSHVVRTVNQDQGRVKLLHNLKDGEALLIMDWAMKFLPLAFREKQTDWFGQKGVNWHVTVCIYRDADNALKHRTYAQTMDGVKQDWIAVACLFEHVLKTIRTQLPSIENVYLRSDNAGCYHCENFWMAIPGIADRTGTSVLRYDYSEAQSGKSYCDAKIAHMRSKIRRAVASGMDVINAAGMKEAIDLNGGVSACQVAHVEIEVPSNTKRSNNSVKGIRKISNIKFNSETITTWKAFEIGEGKEYKYVPSVPLPNITVISDFIVPNESDGNISTPSESHTTSEDSISCSESGCISTFNSFSDMQSHCLIGEHEFSVPVNTYASIKLKWKDVCFNLSSTLNTYRNQSELSEGTSDVLVGWALKKDRKNTRFSDKVKNYLSEVFMKGETTGRKVNAVTVARNMRILRNDNGDKMFSPAEYLEVGQITSYFSRLAVLKKSPSQKEIPDEELDAILLAIDRAETVQELSASI